VSLTAGAQGVLSLNFSSTVGSTIQFNGANSSFQFNSSSYTGNGGIFNHTQWYIGSEAGGTGSALGLFGSVTNGPFTYGPITTIGSEQIATVTGPLGQLNISDGISGTLHGLIDWSSIETYLYAGALNAALTVNITDLTYNGNNQDLKTLILDGNGTMNLTFQFSPGETLSQLSSGNSPFLTSYSGSISGVAPVPEPASLSCLLVGLGVLGSARLLKRNK